MGLALARLAGWGVARLVSAALDGEILRLSKLDEQSLLMEIARQDDPEVALRKRDDIIRHGQATVDRWLPKTRALICPHRDIILKAADSPEITVITTVAGYLAGGLPGALVKPVATLVVKRGIQLLCGNLSLKGAIATS
jgi:hypothetical protein